MSALGHKRTFWELMSALPLKADIQPLYRDAFIKLWHWLDNLLVVGWARRIIRCAP